MRTFRRRRVGCAGFWMAHSWLFMGIGLIVGAAPSFCLSDETAGRSPAEMKELKSLEQYIWNGIRRSREQVLSAHVVITGKDEPYAYPGKPIPRRPIGNVRLEAYFDRARRAEKFATAWGNHMRTRWMAMPDKIVQWIELPHRVVEILPVDGERNAFCYRVVLDAIGLCPLSEWSSTHDLGLDALGNYYRKELESIESQGSVHMLKYSEPYEGTDGRYTKLCEIHVDEGRGFAATRARVAMRLEFGARNEVLQHDLKTSWDFLSGVWLPVKCEAVEPIAGMKAIFNIDWRKVNESFADDVFSIDKIGAPLGTLIVDSRIGPTDKIVVGKVGMPDYVPPKRGVPPVASSSRLWTIVFVIALHLVIGAVLLAWWYRDRLPTWR